MPSSVAHALTALAIGSSFLPRSTPRRIWVLGAACAILLDVDAMGRPFGYGDVHWLGGHRALTHSIPFALGLALLLAFACRTDVASPLRLFIFFASAMIAHGAFDAFTTYGEGVAYFAPVTWRRFKSPWQPFRALWPEVVFVWLPSAAVLWRVWHQRLADHPRR